MSVAENVESNLLLGSFDESEENLDNLFNSDELKLNKGANSVVP